MPSPFYNWSLRRRRLTLVLCVCVLVVAVILAVLGREGRRAARSAAPRDTSTSRNSSSTTPAPSHASSGASVNPLLAVTNDPVQYSKEVASALFEVNPEQTSRAAFRTSWQSELPTVVYSDAAANGLTLGRQNADALQNLTRWWIPSQIAWTSEARDHTINSFRITSVSVPDYWANAVAEGKFRDPGLHMERVMGVLTQTYGTNPTHRYRSARPVVIDLALLCDPTQPGGCRLVAPQAPPNSGTA